MFNPLVSIVIPVYNGANYLREAIDSALAQTYKNLEIIVVNDGSNDDGATEEIALSYGNRIRYYSKPNGGTSTALNVAIRHMKGEYFSWLSHDDMYYPGKIEEEVKALQELEDKNTIIMSDLDGINEEYQKIYKTDYIQHIKAYPPRKNSMLHPIIYNQTHGCTLLIPKACFDEVGLFDEKELVAQDFEFFYRAFKKFPHKLIPKVLVTARDSSNRQGRRSHHKGDIEYSRLFIKMIEEFTDEEIQELAPSRLRFYLDMKEFFTAAGYSIALKYIRDKLCSSVQVSSYDLIGQHFNGHDLHLYLNEAEKESVQIVQYKQSDDKNTYAFNFNAPDATKLFLQQSLLHNAEIVHLHLVHNLFDINYLPVLTRIKPTVMTLHDPFYLGGHCVHHFDCEKWKTMCNDCPYLDCEFCLPTDISALNFELKKEAIQNSSVSAIVASDWMKNKVMQSPIWKGKKVYQVPFGVDQKKFAPGIKDEVKKRLNIPVKDTVVLFRADAGRFKGTDLVISTFERMEKKQDITLLVVGAKGLLDIIKKDYNVKEYGWVQDEQMMINLYQASDLLLMPSRQETFGMMAIEAMSCGVPVVVLQTEGSALPEVVHAPEVGIALKEEGFEEQVSKLLSDKTELAKRSEKCLIYAQAHYSKEVYIETILQVYRDVIDRWQPNENDIILGEQLSKYSTNLCSNQPIVEAGGYCSAGRAGSKFVHLAHVTYHSLQRDGFRVTCKKIWKKLTHKN